MLDSTVTVRLFMVTSLVAGVAACSSGKSSSDSAIGGYTKIDDMEGPGPFIQWTPPPGLTPGFWLSATDCTEATRIDPVLYVVDPYGWSYAALPVPHETFPGIVSAHAARLRTTSPLVGIWGANMGIDLAEFPPYDGGPMWPPPLGIDAGAPVDGQPCRQGTVRDFNGGTVDLSAYSGITFWAMADRTGTQRIRVQLQDRNTDPRGAVCSAMGTGTNADGDCYNGYARVLVLTDTLTRYSIDFSSLQQDPTWGYRPTPSGLDLQHVYQLIFQVDVPSCSVESNAKCAGGAPSVTFDLWIDDLYFVNK